MGDGKRCARCGGTKPTTEFPPGRKWSDGLHPYCRDCKRAADRESWARHKAERSASKARAYAANPEPAKARSRQRYAADPARWKAEAKRWQKANPERRKAIEKKWQQANLHGLVREATRRRYATRKGAPTIYFTPEQLAQRAAYYGWRCWVCREPFAEWDHVKPLTRGGWHCLSNLRPACRSCNAKKGDTWPLIGLTT